MEHDIGPELLITFNEAARKLLEQSRPSCATWWRWWRKGIRGIRLRTVVVGGRRYTTEIAVEEFISATTAAANGEPTPVRTPRQREAAISRAYAEILEDKPARARNRKAKVQGHSGLDEAQ